MPEGQVTFDSDNANEFGRPPQASSGGGGFDLTGALVNAGLIGSREQAEYVLIAVAVLAFLGMGYFVWKLL